MRPSFPFIPERPCHPVLDLEDETEDDMDDKSTEQDDLHDLDKRVGSHEINRFTENILVIGRYRKDEKIDAQVHNHEYQQECPRKSHDEFFGQRGKSKEFNHSRMFLNN